MTDPISTEISLRASRRWPIHARSSRVGKPWLFPGGVENYFAALQQILRHVAENEPFREQMIENLLILRPTISREQNIEIYDAMQHAIDTGERYQTLLDPPPADPRVVHPGRA